MKPPNRTSNHIGKLDAYAHVGRRQKDALNEVIIGGCVLTIFPNKAVVLFAHSVVLVTIPVVRDNHTIGVVTAGSGYVLHQVLKPLGNHLVSSKVYVLLGIYVPKLVGVRRIAYAANNLDGFGAGYNLENGSPELILFVLVPFSHRVSGVVVVRREIAPLNFAMIVFLAFEADEFLSNSMPPFFGDDDPSKYEEPWGVAARECGRPAFVNKTKVHWQ